MASIAEEMSALVTIGLDPHPGSHTASAINSYGRQLGEITVLNSEAGWDLLMEWAQAHPERRWAVEGPNNRYARDFVTHLLEAGEAVYPITPSLTARYRSRSANGKDDEIDATNAGRALLANEDLQIYRPMPYQQELKELTRAYQRIRNEIKANKMSARERSLEVVKEALEKANQALEEAAKTLKRRMAAITKDLAPDMLSRVGIGPLVSATLLAESGWFARFASEDHFASYAGAAPIRWSSGAQETVRVNFRGNRRLNWAAHVVAMSRLRLDPRTQAYRDKKLAEGKTMREVYRLLKTYICREFYHLLRDMQTQSS